MSDTYFIYIDDSSEGGVHIFSAIAIPADRWKKTNQLLKDWRLHLKNAHGIPLATELHAHAFISGRGSNGALRALSRHRRSQIFHRAFHMVEWMSNDEYGLKLFNVCTGNQDWAFERLLNRIDRTMRAWDGYAHLICDEGKEAHYTKMVRRMNVFNHIPSNQGKWADTGASTKNIPLERIVEDPAFKASHTSHLVQLADFIAYGLLRREVPTPKAKRYGIHKSFEQLDNALVKACNLRDKFGIIR